MEFPRDFGNRGQWIPATPAKPIPVTRSAPMPMPPMMSGPSWFSSIDVSGPSGLPWSGPSHGQSPALGSTSQGQLIDGCGGGNFNSVNVSGVSSLPTDGLFAALGAGRRRQQHIDERGGGELNSVDVDGVSGLPWSVPNHRQSAALGSGSCGHQNAGRGAEELGTLGTLVFNSEGIGQMPYTRLLATSDPTIMSKLNLSPFMIARIGSSLGTSSSSLGMNAEHLNQNHLMSKCKTLLQSNREQGNIRSLPQLVPEPQSVSLLDTFS